MASSQIMDDFFFTSLFIFIMGELQAQLRSLFDL